MDEYDGEKWIVVDGQTGRRVGEGVYRCEFKAVTDCCTVSAERGDHPVIVMHESMGIPYFAAGDWSRAHPSYASAALDCQVERHG